MPIKFLVSGGGILGSREGGGSAKLIFMGAGLFLSFEDSIFLVNFDLLFLMGQIK